MFFSPIPSESFSFPNLLKASSFKHTDIMRIWQHFISAWLQLTVTLFFPRITLLSFLLLTYWTGGLGRGALFCVSRCRVEFYSVQVWTMLAAKLSNSVLSDWKKVWKIKRCLYSAVDFIIMYGVLYCIEDIRMVMVLMVSSPIWLWLLFQYCWVINSHRHS